MSKSKLKNTNTPVNTYIYGAKPISQMTPKEKIMVKQREKEMSMIKEKDMIKKGNWKNKVGNKKN